MFSVSKIAAALAAGAGILCAANTAMAEESGSVRLIRTYVQDYTTIDHAGARVTGGTLEGAVTILESSGGPFVEGTHDRATCVVYIKRAEAGFDLEVPCETTAPSGDRWYTLSKRREGDVEAGSGGAGHHGNSGRNRRLRRGERKLHLRRGLPGGQLGRHDRGLHLAKIVWISAAMSRTRLSPRTCGASCSASCAMPAL